MLDINSAKLPVFILYIPEDIISNDMILACSHVVDRKSVV